MSRGIPKTIKLGESEFKVADYPELLALIEAGRTEEKTKLYARIEKAEQDLASITEEKKSLTELSAKDKQELEKANKELEEAKTKLEEFKAGVDDPNQQSMKTEEIQELIKKGIEESKTQSDSKIAELEKQLKQRDLADYRARKIAENNDVIIADFVGTSFADTESIDKAIEDAKAKSKQYLTQDFKFEDGSTKRLTLAEIENLTDEEKKGSGTPPTTPTPTPTPTQVPTPTTPVPTPPAGGGDQNTLIDGIKDMSDSDYEKNREALKQEIKKMSYGA